MHRLRQMARAGGGIAAALAATWLLASCGPTYVAPPVSPQLAAAGKLPQSQLQRGYEVHQLKCAKCHKFENPADYTRDEWVMDIMPEMARKSKLDAADEEAVLAYVLAARGMPAP